MDFEGPRPLNQCRSCSKTFAQSNAFSNHLRSCKKTRSRLQNALAGARRVWSQGPSAVKRPKLTHSPDFQSTTVNDATKEDTRTVDVPSSEDVPVNSIVLNYSLSLRKTVDGNGSSASTTFGTCSLVPFSQGKRRDYEHCNPQGRHGCSRL